MSSFPFAPDNIEPGSGIIAVDSLPPFHSNLRTLSYGYPLKLIAPRPNPTAKAILVFLLTYGGGLVAGDSISLTVSVTSSGRVSLVTQGSTKVFKSPSSDIVTRQTLEVRIEAGSALVYLPDPVQPFAESVYEQKQVFRVAKGGNLCFLDWVSEGRTARGERWDLTSWKGRNEVYAVVDEKEVLLLRDNLLLAGADGSGIGLARRMDGLGVFGTLVLTGPLFSSLGKFFLEEFSALPRIGGRNWGEDATPAPLSEREAWRAKRVEDETESGLLWTAAAVRGLVVVKFGAREVEGGKQWLRSILMQEGTVEREFGEGALLCLA
jgi:urease accessory protein